MKKTLYKFFGLLALVAAPLISSCDDEPDSEYYYSFTGEMMSQYLENRQDLSTFADIVNKAGMMEQLSAYGHYTCFAPTNDVMNQYLQDKGYHSIADMTVADCDTIARTHLINVMYTTFEMKDGVLATQNMNGRPIEISHTLDDDGNAVIELNNSVQIYFAHQNDSVENGMVHQINGVLESSSNMLPKLMSLNPRISIYSQAFEATGISQIINDRGYKDDSYKSTGVFYDYITGSNIHEAATPPDDRIFGWTTFCVPDDVLSKKYKVTDLEGLYKLACSIYDPMYPGDVNAEGHSFDHLDSPVNPLYRFMAYHVLDRNVQGWNFLTVRDDFGVITRETNPTDWYKTLLPYTMMKVEHLTCDTYLGMQGEKGARYINRRVDKYYDGPYGINGSKVEKSVEPEYENMALGGIYFYLDDIIKFDKDTRDIVFNARMRMDFSTIFPELMTNNMRMNGDRTKDDDNSTSAYDHTYKYGRNFYFPNGYLDGVEVGGNGFFIYRRPRQGYWSLHGDEFICQGNYDISFRIPPVPFEGDWQVRLGYAAMDIRGIAQIYFDGVPQGIPLDMTRNLSHESILGTGWIANYSGMTDEQKAEDRKTLKNKGYYRGANGGYRTGGSDEQRFSEIPQTLRIVLCTVHMTPGEDHFLRVRAVSSKQGNNNEVMLDYLELVPKSVYGVDDEGAQEDDL